MNWKEIAKRYRRLFRAELSGTRRLYEALRIVVQRRLAMNDARLSATEIRIRIQVLEGRLDKMQESLQEVIQTGHRLKVIETRLDNLERDIRVLVNWYAFERSREPEKYLGIRS